MFAYMYMYVCISHINVVYVCVHSVYPDYMYVCDCVCMV